MEALGSSSLVCSSFRSSSRRQRRIQATLQAPEAPSNFLSLPKLPAGDLVEEVNMRTGYTARTTSSQIETCPFIPIVPTTTTSTTATRDDEGISSSNSVAISELYAAIMEAVADRAEMHANIEEQRNNWNHLLLTSINTMTMAAATMTGLAATSGMGAPLVGLKLSSTLLYLGATGLLLVMNKIQPSQLAEEQRNAARLFKQLHGQIRTTLALGTPTPMDVKDAMDKVLALDKAYPLPLLGAMLDKFPESVEPAVWWPQQRQRGPEVSQRSSENEQDLGDYWSFTNCPWRHWISFRGISYCHMGSVVRCHCRSSGKRGEHLGARWTSWNGFRDVQELCRIL